MSNPQLSLKLFNEAVEMKRQGKYLQSIELQKQSMRAYPDDPNVMSNFYAIGKVYYLAGNYDMSIVSYRVYANLCAIKNPAILQDYSCISNYTNNLAKKLFTPEEILDQMQNYNIVKQRFHGSFRNLAHNLGHTLIDRRELFLHRKEILWYEYELRGKDPEQEDYKLSGYRDKYEQYDEKCIQAGFEAIYHIYNTFLKDGRNAEQITINLMNSIVDS